MTESSGSEGECSPQRRNYYSELVTGSPRQHPPESARLSRLEIAKRDVMSTWSLIADGRSPSVRALKTSRSTGHPITKERWVTFPDEPTISFPGESFTPKVQMQLDAPPRHLVRNVEMERRRRLYQSLKLELLFYEENISVEEIVAEHFLALEIFDDDDYEIRTPTEWLDIGIVNGERYPVPAESLIKIHKPELLDKPPKCLYTWQPVAVLDYDPSTRHWKIFTLDGSKRTYHIPRVLLRFSAEDPRNYVKRVAAALRDRRYAEAHLKYHLYLDCMPHDEMGTMRSEDKRTIINLVVGQDEKRYNMVQNLIAID